MPEIESQNIVPASPQISPQAGAERRVSGIAGSLGAILAFPFFKNIINFFMTKSRQTTGSADTARQPKKETLNWNGGMTDEEYRAALDRAEKAGPAELADMMSAQPATLTVKADAIAGDAAREIADNLKGNPSLTAMGNSPMPLLAASIALLKQDKTAIDGAVRQQGILDGAVGRMMLAKEPEALRGMIFLRHTFREQGVTLSPTTKFADLAGVCGLQDTYKNLVQSRPNAPSYEQWVRSIADSQKKNGKTSVTLNELSSVMLQETFALILSKRVQR